MALWALAGFLTAFGILAIFSIGLPLLIAGVVLTAVETARGRREAAPAGLVLGVGGACLFLIVSGFADAVPLVVGATAFWTGVALLAGWAAGRPRPRPR